MPDPDDAPHFLEQDRPRWPYCSSDNEQYPFIEIDRPLAEPFVRRPENSDDQNQD